MKINIDVKNENITTYVINLPHRKDRKTNVIEELKKVCYTDYKFFDAINGMLLEQSEEIESLFRENDFGWRKSFIGCALSHYILWKKVVSESKHILILEDDIKINNYFVSKLKDCQDFISKEKQVDILFLGYHMFDNKKKYIDNSREDNELKIKPCDLDIYIGGFFGYIITISGANKLVKYIEKNGIKHGIDYLIKIVPGLNVYECQPFIITSDWVTNNSSTVDSDIQRNFISFNISNDYHIVKINDKKYKYYPGLDSSGNDIAFSQKSIEKLAEEADILDNCVGFNSLGFLKSKIDKIEKSKWIYPPDGLYVKIKDNKNDKNRFRVKMICNWCSSEQLCKEWNNMSQGKCKWNSIDFVSDDANIDYYAIINKPLRNETYFPERTVIFHMEPWCYDPSQNWGVKTWGEWAKPDPNKFLQVRSHENYVNNALWQLNTTYSEFKTMKIDKKHENIISTICSSKYFDPGHIKRIDFLKYIEQQNDLLVTIHIYNYDNHHKFKNYQGPHPPNNKDVGIMPYKYYFMGENNEEKNFITEKIWEPLLTESLCFYWGCPNISDYIHPNAYVLLDLNNFEKSFNIIKTAIQNNLWEQRIELIRAEKQKVLEYYNFFPTMERIIRDYPVEEIEYKKYLSDIPTNLKSICFLHSCNLGDLSVLEELLSQLKKTDVEYIVIINIGKNIILEKRQNIKIINYSDNTKLFEFPTIRLLYNYSLRITKDKNCKILYLHTKGITHSNNKNIVDWRKMMSYFMIDRYKDCLEKLEFFDAIGCNYLQKPYPHFSGNFWWANSKYISTLSLGSLKDRHDAEWWILSKTKNFYCIHDSAINHYLKTYPEKNYK